MSGVRQSRGLIPRERVNVEIASRLEEVAHLLHAQGANAFRVDAYRRAAETVRTLDEPISDLFHREGLEGLDRLPTIGPTIARAIRSMVLTGVYPMLERLRGGSGPTRVLETVPGIGRKLAARLHDEWGVETLEQLELAAHDGSLGALPGFGTKKVRGIQEALATRLGARRRRTAASDAEPPVSEVLDVDREYREKAAAGRLRRITPRRFNPQGEAWLPILHTQRGERPYTALFSNTAQAHRLGKTGDWVVLYYDGDGGERQCTVVTESRGPLAGQRVVRGRESECLTSASAAGARGGAGDAGRSAGVTRRVAAPSMS